MSIKEAFRFRLTTMGIVLIPIAIGINYVGKLLAELLKLPLWIDSIGTLLAAIVAGPWIGAISGAVNNIVFSFNNPISLWYAFTSVGIALVAGVLAYFGWFKSLPKAILAGLVIALTATIISTPINVMLWEGQTGNYWGDALYAILIAKGANIWVASFADELVIDLVDKVAMAMIVYFIILSLPKSFTQSLQASKTVRR